MSHIAFDLGLRTTGITNMHGSDHFLCPAKLRGTERLAWWRDTFRMALLPYPGDDVIVEAPFVHRQHPSGAVELIKLHGILAAVAIDGGHDLHTVTPAELKKWATGKGNADKAAMLAAARRLGWIGDSHDEADAFLLWCYWAGEGEAAA